MNYEDLTPEDLAGMEGAPEDVVDTTPPAAEPTAPEFDPEEFERNMDMLGYVRKDSIPQPQAAAPNMQDDFGYYEDEAQMNELKAMAQRAEQTARQSMALQQVPQIAQQLGKDSPEAVQAVQKHLSELVNEGIDPASLMASKTARALLESVADNARYKSLADRLAKENEELSKAGNTGQQGSSKDADLALINAVGGGAKLSKAAREVLLKEVRS